MKTRQQQTRALMHPYLIEKLAASRRDELLSTAERHNRAVLAHCSGTSTPSRGAVIRTFVASAVAAVVRAVTNARSRPARPQRPPVIFNHRPASPRSRGSLAGSPQGGRPKPGSRELQT